MLPMILIRTHRLQLAALGGASALLALSGALSVYRETSRLRRMSSGLGASYFAFHALRFARLALSPAALVLGKEGVVDRVGSPPAGFLPWDEIASAEVVVIPLGFLARKFVGIRLVSADPMIGGRSRSAFEPPLFQAYAALVPEYVLEDRVEEVVETLNTYIQDAEERQELQSLLYAPGRIAW
jgi:hypothetical protein